jgi:thermostable 8-oxoguanine DNA glycosylase
MGLQVHRSTRLSDKRQLVLPDASEDVVPGMVWGPLGGVPTAAYWATLAFEHADDPRFRFEPTGRVLLHEVAFCVLGGYGIPAEVGWAAFDRLMSSGAVRTDVSAAEIRALLLEPLELNGRKSRYRFVNVKSTQLASALARVHTVDEALPDRALRDALVALPGVGFKTASWIVRNMRASDHVAVLDIHLVRACRRLGLFPASADPARDYVGLEQRFLAFARALGVNAAFLDYLMWEYTRSYPCLSAA